MKTLIAEDEFMSRLFLQNFLSRYGECHIAISGKEALEAFCRAADQGSPYDLICMDILMPVMDGQAAVKQIRSFEQVHGIVSHEGVKIIMITAVAEVEEVIRSFEQLCDAYLFKPVNAADLLGHLRSLRLVN